jgi:PIN domain nuclease of toxin-antitoxin system
MNLLIDTHVVIWSVTNGHQIPPVVKEQLENTDNVCHVSMASLWEMSIKHSLGRLDLHAPLADIFRIIEDSGFELLPIMPAHILCNATLAYHHQDPFDRLIIAQALCEDMTIVSKDGMFDSYGVPLFWK